MYQAIVAARLKNQCISRRPRGNATDLIRWFGAVQAQEYGSSLWALSLRSGLTASTVEQSFNSGAFIRTHVLRPTWHFVAASDLDWMLELTAPRIQRSLSYAFRAFGVDAATRSRAARLLERALDEAPYLTRPELRDRLAKARLPIRGTALGLLVMHAELERIVCSGPLCGRQHTYAAYGSRVRKPRRMSRDEALAELTRRYFQSHGPATTRDFAWWSGLTVADARRGLEINGGKSVEVDGRLFWTLAPARPSGPASRSSSATSSTLLVHLLPIYDEYLVAYRDREAIAPPGRGRLVNPLGPMLVINGVASGSWKVTPAGAAVTLKVSPSRRLGAAERGALDHCAERYQRYSGRKVTLTVTRPGR